MEIQQHQVVSPKKNRSTQSLSPTPTTNRSLNESIASVEEHLFDAMEKGNKRKADALRMVLRRLRRMAESPYLLQ